MLTYRIDSLERAHRDGAYSLVQGRQVFPDYDGYDAVVTVLADRVLVGTLHLDRIDGEDRWHVSAAFVGTCSMPKFMHGLFSRCTIPQHPVEELAAILDAAAEKVGR